MSFLIDSPVWIDYFNGLPSAETDYLHDLLGRKRVVVGDLVLAEVLQGFADERERELAQDALLRFPGVTIGGADLALKAARNARILQARGLPAPPVIDALLATWCIENGAVFLTDRDVEPFERFLGLRRPPQGSAIP